MPIVKLKWPNRLLWKGQVLFEKGVETEVTAQLASELAGDPRFEMEGGGGAAYFAVKPKGDALINAIRDEIDLLDDEDANYDRTGKPSLAVLSQSLGYAVTAEERDRAMSTERLAGVEGSKGEEGDVPTRAKAKPVVIKKTSDAARAAAGADETVTV